jgi:hypothetical protein
MIEDDAEPDNWRSFGEILQKVIEDAERSYLEAEATGVADKGA